MGHLQELLNASAALHGHLCPRQVLGVQMGLHAASVLRLDLPQRDKRLLTIVENDGCFADGISVSTGCWLGRRTLRLVDQGKIAATFIDTTTGEAVRMHPATAARSLARQYAPDAVSHWHAYLEGYQAMPLEKLLHTQRVRLTCPIETLLSRPHHRAICDECGEEVFNEREVEINGRALCRGCAGDPYVTLLPNDEDACRGAE